MTIDAYEMGKVAAMEKGAIWGLGTAAQVLPWLGKFFAKTAPLVAKTAPAAAKAPGWFARHPNLLTGARTAGTRGLPSAAVRTAPRLGKGMYWASRAGTAPIRFVGRHPKLTGAVAGGTYFAGIPIWQQRKMQELTREQIEEDRKQLTELERIQRQSAEQFGTAVGSAINKENPIAKLFGSQQIGKTGPYWSPGIGAAGALGGGLLGAGLGINPMVTALLLGGAGAFLGPKMDLTRWGGPAAVAAPAAAASAAGGK